MPVTICVSLPAAAHLRPRHDPVRAEPLPLVYLMIVTCTACQTRYRLDEQELGGTAGRAVRCTNCGHIWHQAPLAIEAPTGKDSSRIAPAASEAAVTYEHRPPAPRLGVPPRSQPAPALPRRVGRHGLAAFGRVLVIFLALLLVLALLAGIVARRRLSAMWPPAERFYVSIGLPVESLGAGLVIGKIAPARSSDALMVAGEIVNLESTPRDVPRLRVALRDAAEKEVQFEIVDPPKAQLQPGEVEHFSIPISHPVDTATGVVVTFANP
jgi:predicted Zn finger-like uncharacterized protein